MSKIVQAVNAMISNSNLITDVIKNGEELFFLYKGKYKWSITKRDTEEYYLFYYPLDLHISEIAQLDSSDWQDTPMVSYSSTDIGTREAIASFSELYNIIKERVFGVNQVLDDIISDLDF